MIPAVMKMYALAELFVLNELPSFTLSGDIGPRGLCFELPLFDGRNCKMSRNKHVVGVWVMTSPIIIITRDFRKS